MAHAPPSLSEEVAQRCSLLCILMTPCHNQLSVGALQSSNGSTLAAHPTARPRPQCAAASAAAAAPRPPPPRRHRLDPPRRRRRAACAPPQHRRRTPPCIANLDHVDNILNARRHNLHLQSDGRRPGNRAAQYAVLRGGPLDMQPQSDSPSSTGVATAVLPQGHCATSRRS